MALVRLKVSNYGLFVSCLPCTSRTKPRKCGKLCLRTLSHVAKGPGCRKSDRNVFPWYCLPSCSLHNASPPTTGIPGEVTVAYKQGLPEIVVPLPSRQEKCRFTLRPLGNTVSDFMKSICQEDRGVDHVSVYSTDGIRIASSSTIESLLRDKFYLTLNHQVYLVEPPPLERLSSEEAESMSHIKVLVARLYEDLNVSEHQLEQERKLLDRLHTIKEELRPMEEKKQELMSMSHRKTTILSWVGLGLMGVQFGILARLTWWEYSWDIMEPVTYFITYGTTMVLYAYFVITRQEYYLPDVRDRQFLLSFYKLARRHGMDISSYNKLQNEKAHIEEDLLRLRDPLQKHLPLREVSCEHDPEVRSDTSDSLQGRR